MKNNPFRLICLTLSIVSALLLPFEPVFAEPGKPVLKKGMRGDQVMRLQEGLKQLGFFTQDPTGYYGDITEASVIQFQKQYGLSPDGIVGDSTHGKLDSLLSAMKNRPVLRKGMRGAEVTVIQSDLKKLGYFAPEPTGYYGDITETAVIQFQKKYDLTPDGVVGNKTYRKIDSLLGRLNLIKVVVDPGHGGIDIGTSKGKVVESEVTLSIAKKLKAGLEEYAYDVVLTRSTDIALDHLSSKGETRQERDLNARTNIIDKSGAKFFVSIHVNSLPSDTSFTGSIVYYNDKFPKSRELAQNIQKALNGVTAGNLKRMANSSRKADYYILYNSNVPGVLVETAFITNSKERELLATDSFRNKLAEAILTGIRNTNFN